MKAKKIYLLPIISCAIYVVCTFTSACNVLDSRSKEWKAPAEAKGLKNPFPSDGLAQKKGRELYNQYCSSCHGENGYGDGAALKNTDGPKPANFHDERVKKQPDGEIFWKITTARG